MTRITVGNTTVTGYVNMIAENRVLVGSGSYTNKSGEKVFKESVTAFLHDVYDGASVQKGDYVRISGDLIVAPRKNNTEALSASMNIRFKNQMIKTEPPKKTESSSSTSNRANNTQEDEDI